MIKETSQKFVIDEETEKDIEGIRKVNLAAFESEGEANVVDQLRQTSPIFVSLVAKISEQVAGHILFTPVRIEQAENHAIEGLGLAPLAVHPEHQGKGIGSALCRSGLNKIKQAGYPFVVVLGHPRYYPRFGFEPAQHYGVSCGYKGVPQEAFMIYILDETMMNGVSGAAYYRQEFDTVT